MRQNYIFRASKREEMYNLTEFQHNLLTVTAGLNELHRLAINAQ